MHAAESRFTLATLAVLAALLTAPSLASADGLPVQGVDVGRTGVETPSGNAHFVAVRAGQGTFVAEITEPDGRVARSTYLDGRFTIPAVAYDATPSGLSEDGRTLVLIRPRSTFPQAETTFAVLDAQQLKVRDTQTLEGDFSFDALSPDGRTLYLIEYSSRDHRDYQVRAFDLARNRLDPEPIVDPTEPDERMAGLPMSRASSPDGRWEYTLYEGARGHEPFIHALDTKAGTAACIDLPQLEGQPGHRLGLEVAGGSGTMTVLLKGQPTLAVNPDGFEVSEIDPPSNPAPAAQNADPAPAPAHGGFEWELVAVALAFGIGIAAVIRPRRRRRTPTSEEELAALVTLEDRPEEGLREAEHTRA